MTAANRRVLAAVALLLIGLAACIADAAVRGVWLVPVAYGTGAGAAWFTFAAAVKLGVARQRAAIEANRERIIERFQQLAERQKKGTSK